MSGGFLSQLGIKYPLLFPEGTLFARFPYLAPMMLVSLLNLVGCVLGFFLLPETLAPRIPRHDMSSGAAAAATADIELKGLLQMEREPAIGEADTADNGSLSSTDDATDLDQHESRSKDAGIQLSSVALTESKSGKPEPALRWVPPVALLRNRPFLVIVAVYMLLRVTFIMGDEVLSLWAMQGWWVGGLNFSSNHIGIVQMCAGAALLLVQLSLFPMLIGKFGALVLFKLGMVGLIPGMCFSFVSQSLKLTLLSCYYHSVYVLLLFHAFSVVNLGLSASVVGYTCIVRCVLWLQAYLSLSISVGTNHRTCLWSRRFVKFHCSNPHAK